MKKIMSRLYKFLRGWFIFSFIELRRLNTELFDIVISIVPNWASIMASKGNRITRIKKNWEKKNSFLLQVCKPILFFSMETISTSGTCRSSQPEKEIYFVSFFPSQYILTVFYHRKLYAHNWETYSLFFFFIHI